MWCWGNLPDSLSPEPHCSINCNSRNTVPSTLFRSCETPDKAVSKLSPKSNGPGLVTSNRSSKMLPGLGIILLNNLPCKIELMTVSRDGCWRIFRNVFSASRMNFSSQCSIALNQESHQLQREEDF